MHPETDKFLVKACELENREQKITLCYLGFADFENEEIDKFAHFEENRYSKNKSFLSWSPNGGHFIYYNGELYVFNDEGVLIESSLHTTTYVSGTGNNKPRIYWSPNGNYLIYLNYHHPYSFDWGECYGVYNLSTHKSFGGLGQGKISAYTPCHESLNLTTWLRIEKNKRISASFCNGDCLPATNLLKQVEERFVIQSETDHYQITISDGQLQIVDNAHNKSIPYRIPDAEIITVGPSPFWSGLN